MNNGNEFRTMLDMKPAISPSDTLTDHTNGKLVVHWFGDKIRYLKDRDVFLVWNGKYWEKNDNLLHSMYIDAMKRAQAESLNLPSETEEERRRKKEFVAHFIASENAFRMKNAKFEMPMFEEINCMNSEFDAVPNIITVRNGTVNLETGELMPFDPNNKCTRYLDTEFSPDATSQSWSKFLRECFRDDIEIIKYVQTCIGSWLFRNISHETIHFFIGPGGSGKGTFIHAIEMALGGEYGITNTLSQNSLLENKRSGSAASPDIAKLYSSVIVFVQELSDNMKLSEQQMKRFTGGDKIAARFLNENEFSFTIRCNLVLSTNYEPLFDGNDSGMARRVKKIYFGNRPATPDPTLKARLSEESSRSAILRWIVDGAVEYKTNGLVVPESITRWSQELLEKNNPVKMAIDEYLVFDSGLPALSSITVSAFRKRLDQLLKDNSMKPLTRRQVVEILENLGVTIKQSKKQDVLLGYRLCPDISNAEFEELNGESIFAVA